MCISRDNKRLGTAIKRNSRWSNRSFRQKLHRRSVNQYNIIIVTIIFFFVVFLNDENKMYNSM